MMILNSVLMNREDQPLSEAHVADFFAMQEEVPIMTLNNFVTCFIFLPQN
jgi:hypothetical protein